MFDGKIAVEDDSSPSASSSELGEQKPDLHCIHMLQGWQVLYHEEVFCRVPACGIWSWPRYFLLCFRSPTEQVSHFPYDVFSAWWSRFLFLSQIYKPWFLASPISFWIPVDMYLTSTWANILSQPPLATTGQSTSCRAQITLPTCLWGRFVSMFSSCRLSQK